MSGIPHLLDQRRLIGVGGSTVSGTMFFYYTGTEILAPIYADASLLVPRENPVDLAAGQIIPSIYLDSETTYRRRIVYADGSFDDEDPLGSLFSEGEFGVPIGTSVSYYGGNVPDGWLLEDGAEYSRTTYAELFAAIGTTYGSGNGTTTFNVPDSRGRTHVGKDNMGGTPANRVTTIDGDVLGASGGSETHTLTVGQIPSHAHTINDPGHQHSQISLTSGAAGPGGGNDFANQTTPTGTSTTGISVNANGGDGAHNNLQPSLIVTKMIKATASNFFSLLGLYPDFTGKANAAALGVGPTAASMGDYESPLLTDGQSAKENIEELAAATEARVTYTALADPDGASEVGSALDDAGAVNVDILTWLRDQVITPRQFGLVGDGETIENPVLLANFFNAIRQGKKGYLPAGCWLRVDAQQIITFSNLQHFYLEGAGAEICGIRFSGTASPFLRFNYANLYNAVHFRNLTLAVDTASDASGCISLYGVGHGAPANAAQNDFMNVVWRGWDGRVQTHYWGNCLYTHLVSNVMVHGGGSWGPNDSIGKGKPFIFEGDASDANPYAVHFDFDTVLLTQYLQGITLGTYTQGLTLKAVNMNRGDYGIYIGAGQTANDIITVGGGSQFNCNVACIGCFEDEATIVVEGATFVIERVNAVGIRTASRWGRFTGNHFQGIGALAGTAGVHCISGADTNIICNNVFSNLPLGCLYDSGTTLNLQTLNRFDSVTTSHIDNGSGNILGVVSI